jgi:parallel beta-helix repeat protein
MIRYVCAFLSPLAAPLLLASSVTIATVSVTLPTQAQTTSTETPYNLLHVNPNSGNDSNDGSTIAPFKTLSRALEAAPSGTIIILAPGIYNAANGERFPIFMKPGVTIQGDPRDRGQSVVIQGSGAFLSRTFAKQKVAIVGAHKAGLRGVTVSNSEPQGYGLWIESSSPVVSDNTFMGNNHDGVSIVGSSAPILRNNYFLENGANGVTIYGNSTAELVENIFEKTGFGINIAQNAAPRLISNRVTQNKDGIVVQGYAQPILRNNVIDANQRDGLVVIAQAKPDLGNQGEAGGNNFLGNGGLDVNAKAATQAIPATGNQLKKSSGNLDFDAIATAPQPAPHFATIRSTLDAKPVEPVASVGALPKVEPKAEVTDLPTFTLPSQPNRIDPKLVPIARPADTSTIAAGSTSTSGRSLPKVPELRVSKPNANTSSDTSLLTLTSDQIGIPIKVPQPESNGVSAQPISNNPLPASSRLVRGEILPVPGGNIPLGNVGNSPSVAVWQPGAAVSRASVRYRVVVSTIDSTQIAQVQAIAPGAFTTRVKGQIVMQAGAFTERSKADELLGQLLAQGLPASVDE